MSKYSSLTAQRLREAMNTRGIKASELAEKSGVSKSNISGYMNGKYTPTNINAIKIANVLQVQPEWLMGLLPADFDENEPTSHANPIIQDICTIADSLDDYFIEKLLAYAKKLSAMQNDLDK